jgi:hypothetical protein
MDGVFYHKIVSCYIICRFETNKIVIRNKSKLRMQPFCRESILLGEKFNEKRLKFAEVLPYRAVKEYVN